MDLFSEPAGKVRQLVFAVKFEGQGSLSSSGGADLNLAAQSLGQRKLNFGAKTALLFSRAANTLLAAGHSLNISDRCPFNGRLGCGGEGLFIGDGQEGAGVTRGYLPIKDQPANILGQTQQAQSVCNGGAAFADKLGNPLLGQRIIIHQLLIALGFFDRIKILSLKVFDKGKLSGFFIGAVLYNNQDMEAT